MRIPSGVTDQYIYFVAVDSTDLKTRETGLSSFTVYRSRDGAAAAAMTTPTINETDSSNMPGVYELLLDEDMTIGSGNDSEEMVFHITHAGMAPVTRVIELYRSKITAGYTLGVGADGDLLEVNTLTGHTAQTGDNYARLGAPAGASIAADLVTIDNFVDDLESRLTATRAGYLDELGPTNIPADLDAVLADTNELQSDDVPGLIAALNDLSAADVNAEVDTALADYDPPTKAELDSGLAGLNDPTAAAIADAVWDEDIVAAHNTADTAGALLDDVGTPSDFMADVSGLATSAALSTHDGKLDTVDGIVDDILADTNELQTDDVPGLIAALNDVSEAQVNAQVDAAIETYHLDHLLAVDYDPASKPGTATALLNELVENDSGVSRFTANALEEAPTGGSAPTAAEIVDEWETQSQADPTGFHVNVMEVNGTAQTANDNGADINAILTDTGTTLPATLSTIEGKVDTVDSNVDAVLVDTGTDIPARFDGIEGATFVTGTDSLEAIRNRGDAAWTTGSGTGLSSLATGTAQAGAAGTITLAAGASATDDLFNGTRILLTGGTGAGQARIITDYNGTTKVASIAPNWTTNPDATSTYEIQAADGYIEGYTSTRAGYLDELAAANIPADLDAVLADTNELQTDDVPGLIAALNNLSAADVNAEVDTALADYDAPTKAELDSGLAALNDPTAAAIADAVLDEALSGHVGAGSLGKAVADIETDATAILADTNELQGNQGDWATATTVDLNADQSGVTIGTVTTNTDMRGTDNAATAAALATHDGKLDTVDTNVDSILADTNELQGDWANGGRLDLILDELTTQGDTNEGKIDTVDTNVDAVLVDTDTTIPGLIAALNDLSAADVNAEVVDVIRTDTLPDSVAADGSASTIAQAVYLMLQFLTEKAVSGTTVTVKKPDGSTSLATFTLDDGASPTSITRAT
jgi:hypothetical protein